MTAPEFLRLSLRWQDRRSLIDHFKSARDRTIEYVRTTGDDLRAHFMPHPGGGGEIDAYQLAIGIAGHCERHVAQIVEVKADAKYPK